MVVSFTGIGKKQPLMRYSGNTEETLRVEVQLRALAMNVRTGFDKFLSVA